ncbi:hypothetical protein M569_09385 [Genlisea aurea]|uniref:Uncharacterized protein n=1 Tax=Genlisea aurea TaxID=192259 RepID=S8DQS6_9LAMI|nr:hypothetical protein M569_09385 [Genlisea aurea]
MYIGEVPICEKTKEEIGKNVASIIRIKEESRPPAETIPITRLSPAKGFGKSQIFVIFGCAQVLVS